jgi:site-specific DNA recombinase
MRRPGSTPASIPVIRRASHSLDAADPCNVTLGYRSVQRWNLPDGWVISSRPAHPALVSEADFIAAQDVNAARGPAPQGGPVLRRCLLACGVCGRRMESAWSNDRPAYRCRHGHAFAPFAGRDEGLFA